MFQLHEISEADVFKQLLGLEANKSVRLNNIAGNIGARLLKCAAQSISYSITKLENLSISTSKFPGIWKCSKLTALFESGDRTNATNYGPILILLTLSKIVEGVIRLQLSVTVHEFMLISICQCLCHIMKVSWSHGFIGFLVSIVSWFHRFRGVNGFMVS